MKKNPPAPPFNQDMTKKERSGRNMEISPTHSTSIVHRPPSTNPSSNVYFAVGKDIKEKKTRVIVTNVVCRPDTWIIGWTKKKRKENGEHEGHDNGIGVALRDRR